MKTHPQLLALAAAAAFMLAAGSASADSQYGSGTGAAAVTAQAHVNLVINVPKIILLRVGGQTGAGDTLTWNSGVTWVTAPAIAPGNNQAANWNGAAPTAAAATNPAAVAVFAWTNAAGGGSLSYAATAFGAGGPTLGNITVTSAAGLAHPAPAALATASTAPTTFGANTLATGSWTYTLGGTPATWASGAYTSTVTYTATSV